MAFATCFEIAAVAALLIVGAILVFAPDRPRNRRRDDVLGEPHPACQRNYVP